MTRIRLGDTPLIRSMLGRLTALETPPVAPEPDPVPEPASKPLRISGPLAFAVNAEPGELVACVSGVPAGASPVLSPADGRLIVAGNGEDGWRVNRGPGAGSVGGVDFTVSAAGALPTSATVTITAAPTMTTPLGTIALTGLVAGQEFAAVHTATGLFPWKAGMAADFSNLLFTAPDGTVLIPWIAPESVVPGVSCVPWIKSPVAGSASFAYGTTTATMPHTTARGTRVFRFFDDFLFGWDATKWTKQALGPSWPGYVDTWRFDPAGSILIGGAFNQGTCADGQFVYGGYNDGDGVPGRIYKYDYAGNLVTIFYGVPHNNGLSFRSNGNILACSAGNGQRGPGQQIVREITPDGVTVRTWDYGDGLFFGAGPNGCFMADIPGGFRYIVVQFGQGRAIGQVLNCYDDGTWAADPLFYELDYSTLKPGWRGQGVSYRDGVLYYMTDDPPVTGSSFGTCHRWMLKPEGVGTALEPWQHIPASEREAIGHDGTHFFYSTFAGTVNRMAVDAFHYGGCRTPSGAGPTRAFAIGNVQTSGPAIMTARSWLVGVGPYFGLTDADLSDYVVLGLLGSVGLAGETKVDGAALQKADFPAVVGFLDYHTYEVRVKPGEAVFTRDGAVLGTRTTGIPAVPLAPRMAVTSGTGEASGSIGAQYVHLRGGGDTPAGVVS